MRRLRVRFRGYTVTAEPTSFAYAGQAADLRLGLPTIDGSLTLAQSNMDATTWTSYSAALTAGERAAVIVGALTGTVVVEVVDAVGNVRASGTMVAPWATASGATVTIGEVSAAYVLVASGGVPDSGWRLQFRSGSRFVRGTFGVSGEARAFVWSLPAFASGGKATIGTVTLTATAAVLPTVASAPVISGTVQAGQTLSSSAGGWNNDPTSYAIQWQRASTSGGTYADVPGATLFSYSLTGGDVGFFFRARVTASNAAGTSAASISNVLGPVAAAPVAAAAPLNSAVPLVLGAPEVGATLTVQNGNGTWLNSPTGFTSAWQRSDTGTGGWADVGSGSTYTVQAGDVGKYLRRTTVATNAQGSGTASSGALGPVTAALSVPLLSSADFTYLGFYYAEPENSNAQVYSAGLTLRRVGGEVRLMTLAFGPPNYDGPVIEFSLAGKVYASGAKTSSNTITGTTAVWTTNGWIPTNGVWRSIWWDSDNSRLWALGAVDYDTVTYPTDIQTFTLGAGTLTNRKRVSLQGVAARRAFTGMMSVPASVQSDMGIGPFIVGLGGYTSLRDTGGGAAMGLAMYAMPDPAGYADQAVIPTGVFKTLATRGGGAPHGRRLWNGHAFVQTGTFTFNASNNTPSDHPWYNTTQPAGTFTGDGPLYYYDGGEPRQNPSTDPTFMPYPTAYASPRADGNAQWVWGDKYHGGAWIDTASRRGVLAVGSFSVGRNWYAASEGRHEASIAEVHIFDPEHLRQVLLGSRAPDNVQPVSMRSLTETRCGVYGTNQSRHYGAYDPVDKRLYVWSTDWGSPYTAKIHVYQVNA